MKRLSATHFYQYLTCPMSLWFKVHGDKSDRQPESDLEKMFKKRGAEHEEAVLKEMGFGEECESVESGDLDERAAETLDLMGKGECIYQGVLIHDNWVGVPDFLITEPGSSKLGPFVYAPIDVKSSLEVKEEHRFQLVFYALLLERIQGVRPKYGYIINSEMHKIAIEIEPLLPIFSNTLEKIEKIFSGEKPPPFLSSSCKQTPWMQSCITEAVMCDDISQIYRIRRDEYASLREAGIVKVKDMADADLSILRDQVSLSIGRLNRLRDHAVCYLENTHKIINEPFLPEASVEVYYDVESDTIANPDVHYLHGVLIVEKPIGRRKAEKVTYKKFLVRNPKQEGVVWEKFARWIVDLPKDVAIYHYGMYEHRVVRELTERYGTPKEALGQFGDMIDLMKMSSRNVLFPVHFYSLKDIAKYLGFKWRTKGATGGASVEWYHDWRKKKDAKTLKKIVEYNEDDVRATKILKDFLAGL